VFPLIASTYGALVSVAFVVLPPGSDPPVWVKLGILMQFPLWVMCLLTWPADRRPRLEWHYLGLDLGIVALAAGLLVWYHWFQADYRLNPDVALATASPLILLIGVNAAVVRRPTEKHLSAFMLVCWFAILAFVANTGLAIVNPPGRLIEQLMALLLPVMFLLAIAAAEALRTEWPWPLPRPGSGSSPVPWVAVMAIGFFVLNLVFTQRTTGVGPIVLGAMGTMILLVARQAVTMRQNARLQAERAALEADARIAALVRHTSDVILITDSALQIRFASPSAEALWTGHPTDLVGRYVPDLVDPLQERDVLRFVAERTGQPGQSDVAKWRIKGPNGDWRRIEAVVTNLFHQPSVNGIVITLRDQTERALLEEQLNQAQKMEAIGQLAGGVAHDFNNLLTTMMGHSEVGYDTLDPDHPAREDFAQIRKATELAAGLTNQLLAFSRKQVIEPKTINVTDSLAQVVKLLRRLIKEDVTTSLEVAPDVGFVRMDPSQLEQVVLNLAINARDAMPAGGRLTIRSRRHQVTADILDAVLPVPRGEYVVIEVIDTGTGMDRATQQKIFEPFFTTKPVGRGTGLGLASVYGVIRQNEGGLLLDSAPGKGTSFAVYLRRVEPEPETAGAGPSSRPPRGVTILLVEDQEALRDIAVRVLEREGHRVMVASDSDEALMLAAGAPYPIDLVVTDVIMPGLSGPRMVEEIRRRREIPRVLYMSGYPGEDLAKELSPTDRLLRKPFTPFVLLENVRAVLEGRSEAPAIHGRRSDSGTGTTGGGGGGSDAAGSRRNG
jgi:PAS domain S-box-containing protein